MAPAGEPAIVTCRDVRFTYDGERDALAGVSLDIAPGEFVCVLGGNGSGKSTLARHLNALLVPDAGSVRVAGLDTADARLVYDIRSTAGMVFQNPDDQLVASLVEADVAFGPENLGVGAPELTRRVARSLAEVGLGGFERHETHELSGGQKQRVAIAGVLAMQPRVLILDEASAMLDPRGRSGLMRVCRDLNANGMTIVMITHHMDEAAEADRVIVLDAGRVACQGTPDEVFAQTERLAGLQLEQPFPYRLALALRERGLAVVPHVRAQVLVDELASQTPRARAARDEAATGARDATKPVRDDGAQADDAIAALRLEHVSYSYAAPRERTRHRPHLPGRSARRHAWGNDPNAVWALDDVSLTVAVGEVVGIAGHTGSGKSTLVQHLNGLVHPTRGRVLAFGDDLADKRAAARAKARIGVVFQYPETQLFAPTVRQDVAFGPRNLGLSVQECDARVCNALRRVGLDPDAVLDASPFELSGGQQRRVALAGVLAMRPEVLVLDEPAAGLDPSAHRELLRLVRQLNGQGLAIVMVSHNMDDLAELCDRIVVLNEGRVFAQGTPREVFSHPEALHDVGLGLPAAQDLALRLDEAGLALDRTRLYDLDALADAVSARIGAAKHAPAPTMPETACNTAATERVGAR